MSTKSKKPLKQPAPIGPPGPSSSQPAWESNQALLELFEKQKTPPVQALRAGGLWESLDYPMLQDLPGSQAGTRDHYSLSFRDRSGYRGSTSQAFLNKAGGGNKWKGLRLDHGPNVKTGNQVNWHWNQKGAMNAFGRPDHAVAGPVGANAGRFLRIARPLARKATFIGAGMDAVSLTQEIAESSSTGDWSNSVEKGAEIAGGWGGAWAGAKGGGSLGAGIGTGINPGIGTVIGGALGAFIGGVGGYLGGSWLGRKAVGGK